MSRSEVVPPIVLQALLTSLDKRGIMDRANRRRLLLRAQRAGISDLPGLRRFLASGAMRPAVANALQASLPTDDMRHVGGCALLAHLADGGMGSAWLGERQGELVVVKTLKRRFAEDPLALRRFERESRLTATLDHPNVVHCWGHGVEYGTPFLILEFVAGGDIGTLIRRSGTVGEREALGILLQTIRGLAHAWERTLIHRDIKPANLLVDSSGLVKVADFGLAREAANDSSALTVPGTVVGSPAFMAPEQIRAEELGWQADVYACGCVLHNLLAGRPPFGGSVSELFAKHLTQPPPDLRGSMPDLSRPTVDILARCLAKRAGDRYPSPDALLVAVGAALQALGGDPEATLSSATINGSTADMPILPPPPTPVEVLDAIPIEEDTQDLQTLRENDPADAWSGDPLRAHAGDWITLCDSNTRPLLILLARASVVCGKLREAPVDLCLRDYPVAACQDSCQRVSRQHVRIALASEASLATVTDLGSGNGTCLDGRVLQPQRAWPLTENVEHELVIPHSVRLRIRILPQRSRRCDGLGPLRPTPGTELGIDSPAVHDAAVITRSANRRDLAYALVLRRMTIGGPTSDLPLAGWTADDCEIARCGGRWIRRQAGSPWQPLAPGDEIGPCRVAVGSYDDFR